jgi:hypothetical protein
MTSHSPSPDFGSVPPRVGRPIPKEQLPPELQSVLSRLAQRYGPALHVNVTDVQWVEISVEKIPAAVLAAQLQSERKVLFGTAEPRIQVITPLRPLGNSVCLHLPTEPDWGDLAGQRFSGK